MKLITAVAGLVLCAQISALAGLREEAPAPGDFTLPRIAMLNRFYRDAADEYQKLIARYPRSPEAWSGLGSALSSQRLFTESHAAYATAADLYREQTQRSPDDVRAHAGLVEALRRGARAEAANEALAEALRLHPGDWRLTALEPRVPTVKRPDPRVLVTRVYLIEGGIEDEITGKAPAQIKALLEQRGITFPEGASVIYLASRKKLVLRNTEAAHTKADALTSESPD